MRTHLVLLTIKCMATGIGKSFILPVIYIFKGLNLPLNQTRREQYKMSYRTFKYYLKLQKSTRCSLTWSAMYSRALWGVLTVYYFTVKYLAIVWVSRLYIFFKGYLTFCVEKKIAQYFCANLTCYWFDIKYRDVSFLIHVENERYFTSSLFPPNCCVEIDLCTSFCSY